MQAARIPDAFGPDARIRAAGTLQGCARDLRAIIDELDRAGLYALSDALGDALDNVSDVADAIEGGWAE